MEDAHSLVPFIFVLNNNYSEYHRFPLKHTGKTLTAVICNIVISNPSSANNYKVGRASSHMFHRVSPIGVWLYMVWRMLGNVLWPELLTTSINLSSFDCWINIPFAIDSILLTIIIVVASFKKTLKTFLFQKAFLWFYVLFNLAFSRFYAVFYDLSSLGNFYSFSVDIIVLLFLVASCTFCMHTLCTYYYYYNFILFLF